jgi:hypothetical protein
MISLQLLNAQKHLLYLVCFRFSFMILDIYPWIPLPGRFVYSVAATRLAGISKVEIANFPQITVSHTVGVPLHLQDDIFNLRHDIIVSLLIALSRDFLSKEYNRGAIDMSVIAADQCQAAAPLRSPDKPI